MASGSRRLQKASGSGHLSHHHHHQLMSQVLVNCGSAGSGVIAAIFSQKLTHGRTRPSSNGVEPWSHGMEPWLFRPMAWSHGCFGHSLWRGAMAVSAISLREQIKPKRQTRLPEAHVAVHTPLYHEILWALSQIARLQLFPLRH